MSGTEVCIAPGYSVQLIDSLLIPTQYYPKAEDFVAIEDSIYYNPIEVHDMWCTVEAEITTSSSPSYSALSNYAGVETTTNGYYTFVNSGTSVNIYATNNSSQNITSITLDNLVLATENTDADDELMDRDRINETQNFGFNVTFIDGTSSTYYTNGADAQTYKPTTCAVTIRPNDTILLCTITDIADGNHTNYIISRYNVKVVFEANAETSAVDLIKNINTGRAGLVNNSEDYYEFRIVIPSSNGATIINYNNDSTKSDFVLKTVGTTKYYHYKGVICPGQYISILEGLTTTNGVEVEVFKHVANGDATYYVASNYTSWTNVATEWLTAMQKIYSAPTFGS